MGQREAEFSSFHTHVMDMHQLAPSDGHLLDHFYAMPRGKALGAPQTFGWDPLFECRDAVFNLRHKGLGVEHNPCHHSQQDECDIVASLKRRQDIEGKSFARQLSGVV